MDRLLLSVIILVILCWITLFPPRHRQQAYYVTNAQFLHAPGEPLVSERWAPQHCQRKLVDNHRLARGEQLVLIIRKWDRHAFWREDDDTYEKLTIAIANPAFGQLIDAGSLNAQLYYSAGKTIQPQFCAGIFSTTSTGYLIVTNEKLDRLTVDLNIHIEVQDAGTLASLAPIAIRDSLTLHAVSLEFIQADLG